MIPSTISFHSSRSIQRNEKPQATRGPVAQRGAKVKFDAVALIDNGQHASVIDLTILFHRHNPHR